MPNMDDRRNEWFVPMIGPIKLRIFIGLLFLPYTGMVLAFTIIGATLADVFYPDRAGMLVLVYFLALGIAAHALDALGSRGVKPWSTHFSPIQLRGLVVMTLLPAAAISAYYAIHYAPLLWPIGLLEFFFLFAYNLEWFKGRFHSDGWFIFSWGMLPVLAGYVMQTNHISLAVLVMTLAAGLFSLVEITASRPYKTIQRLPQKSQSEFIIAATYERILKSISFSVILLGLGMLLWRWPIPFWP